MSLAHRVYSSLLLPLYLSLVLSFPFSTPLSLSLFLSHHSSLCLVGNTNAALVRGKANKPEAVSKFEEKSSFICLQFPDWCHCQYLHGHIQPPSMELNRTCPLLRVFRQAWALLCLSWEILQCQVFLGFWKVGVKICYFSAVFFSLGLLVALRTALKGNSLWLLCKALNQHH